MKKILALLLALIMCLSLCACGDKSDAKTDDDDEKQEQEEKDKDKDKDDDEDSSEKDDKDKDDDKDNDKDSSVKDDKDEDTDEDEEIPENNNDDDDEDTPFVDMSDELGDYQTSNLIAIDGVIYDTDTTVGNFFDNGWEIEITDIYDLTEDSFYAEYESLYDVTLVLTKNNSYFETSVTTENYPEGVADVIDFVPFWYFAYEDSNVNMQLPGGVIFGEVFENDGVFDVYCSGEDETGYSYLCDTDYCYLYFTTDTDNVVNYIQFIPYGFE